MYHSYSLPVKFRLFFGSLIWTFIFEYFEVGTFHSFHNLSFRLMEGLRQSRVTSSLVVELQQFQKGEIFIFSEPSLVPVNLSVAYLNKYCIISQIIWCWSPLFTSIIIDTIMLTFTRLVYFLLINSFLYVVIITTMKTTKRH